MEIALGIWRFYFQLRLFRYAPERDAIDYFELRISRSFWLSVYKTRSGEVLFRFYCFGAFVNNDMRQKQAPVKGDTREYPMLHIVPVLSYGIGKHQYSRG